MAIVKRAAAEVNRDLGLRSNPIPFVIATWIVLAWKTAGWWGLDRWVLPALGTPWSPGRVFQEAGQQVATRPSKA